MIIDELIAVLFSFVGFLLEALSGIFVLIFNGFAYLIEFVMLLFVSDFSLGRAKKYKRNKNQNTSEHNHQNIQNSKTGHFEKLMPLMVVVFVVGYFVISSYLKRDITFVADDGHSLPFASVVIYQGDDILHKRTKNDGHLEISRFGIDKIVLNDKRYKTTTWQTNEVDDILTVKRSLLGKGVDKLATKLLERFKGE